MQSLWTSLTGMKSSLSWLDRVSNNMANENTVGYAKDEGSFKDAFTMAYAGNPAVNDEAGRKTPPGWWGGTGAVPTEANKDFSTMPLEKTDNEMDLAIQGNSFFVVGAPNGQVHLTKAGNFTWSKGTNGTFFLATQQGAPVLDTNGQKIAVSGNGVKTLSVGPDGKVTINGQPTTHKIALANVALAGEKLQAVGNNEFAAKPGVQVQVVNRGNALPAGTSITQGALSMSNVDIVVEMTDMIQAQNLFALNAQSLKIANKMMQDANSIRS